MFQVFSKYICISLFGCLELDSIMAYWPQDSSLQFFILPRYNEIVGLMLVFPSSSTWIEDEKKSINRKEPSITTTLLLLLLLLGIACCVVLCVVLL